MAALTAPRDTAEGTWSYSAAGSVYTDLANVIDAKLDPRTRAIIKRLLVGADGTAKFTSRLDCGKLTITQEWFAALYAVFNALLVTKTQTFYMKYTWADTGGGGNSTLIYQGNPCSITDPSTPAANEVAKFEFVLDLTAFTFTTGS